MASRLRMRRYDRRARSMDEEVLKTLSLPEVCYSRVWEDHRVISKGLAIQPQDTVLCITSSGDSVLNLLLDEPRKIVAVDLSQAQNSLLELKLAGVRCLCHEEFLLLLGEIEDTQQRWDDVYAKVRESGRMPAYAQQYWDVHHKSFKSGGNWCGKFDKFILNFSTEKLPGAVSAEQVDRFLSAPSLEEQRRIFDRWPIERFKEVYRQLVSKGSQSQGRGVAKLKFVQMSDSEIQDFSWARLERVCRDVPVRDNFYLSWLLRGRRGYDPLIRPDYAPPYLSRENFDRLKALVDRVVVHTGAVEDYFTYASCETPSKLALSNIFEYMNQESADKIFDTFGSHLPTGGRIVFWEYMNLRLPSTTAAGNLGRARLHEMVEECQELRREDRTVYFSHHVLQVK